MDLRLSRRLGATILAASFMLSGEANGQTLIASATNDGTIGSVTVTAGSPGVPIVVGFSEDSAWQARLGLTAGPDGEWYVYTGNVIDFAVTSNVVAGAQTQSRTATTTFDTQVVTVVQAGTAPETLTVQAETGGNAAASVTSGVYGTTSTLTATPLLGYSFSSWSLAPAISGGSLASVNASPTTFTFGATNALVTANFIAGSAITVAVGPNGSATANPTAGGTGTTTTLTATPDSGYHFFSWRVNQSGGGTIASPVANPTTFTFGNQNATVTANFASDVDIVFAPSPTGPVDQPIDLPNQAPNLILVIHGYTPGSSTPYSDGALMPNLAAAIETRLQQNGTANQWDVCFYDWSSSSGGGLVFPQTAVRNGIIIGEKTGQLIVSQRHYNSVQLIGWSAGTWPANQIAQVLNANNISTSVTFLDAFIPSYYQQFSTDDEYTPNLLGAGLPQAEQYLETISYAGIGIALPNAANYDITSLQSCAQLTGDAHGWPVQWYTKTVQFSDYPYGFGLGFPDAFAIPGTDGTYEPLFCPGAPTSQAQFKASFSQSQNAASSVNYEEGTMTMPSGKVIPLPPMPPGLLDYMAAHKSAALDSPMIPPGGFGGGAGSGGTPPQPQFNSPSPQVTILQTDFAFANLGVVAQGESGGLITNADGIELATTEATNFMWANFQVPVANDINFAALNYSNAAPQDSVVSIWLDGQLIQPIQSDANSPLPTVEILPLSRALSAGNHILSIGLESLDGTPIATTVKNTAFLYWVTQPVINSLSIDRSNNFVFRYEAAAGLNYQAQYTTNLSLGQWSNLGGLQTPLTNALIQIVDPILTDQQRFYQVVLQQ